MCGTMQTPRDACEMHYVKWGKITHFKIFFFIFLNHALIYFKILLFSFACCGAMAIMWQARIVVHCSVHCSCFLGVGGKTETALTPPLLLPFSSRKGASQYLLSNKRTITHLCVHLSNFNPDVSVIYSLSFPHSQL